MFYIGVLIGGVLGIATMCLLQINRDNRIEKERDYWKAEALKWCNKLGEIRMFVDKPN